MEHHNRRHIDTWLLRLKDLLIVGAAIWAIFTFGTQFVDLPKKVENQTISIEKLKEVDDAFNIRMYSVEKDIGYISRTVGEMNDSLKRQVRADGRPRLVS